MLNQKSSEEEVFIISYFLYFQLNLNERDFSNTFCSRFLAEADKCGVAFVAFSSALRTKSSAVAPSKTGMFLIVIAIIVVFRSVCISCVIVLFAKIVYLFDIQMNLQNNLAIWRDFVWQFGGVQGGNKNPPLPLWKAMAGWKGGGSLPPPLPVLPHRLVAFGADDLFDFGRSALVADVELLQRLRVGVVTARLGL